MDQRDSTDDWIALLMLLTGVSGFGLFSLGKFFAPVREFLVQSGVLVEGSDVVIAIEGEAGLDIWRLLVVLGALALVVAVLVGLMRSRARRRRMGR